MFVYQKMKNPQNLWGSNPYWDSKMLTELTDPASKSHQSHNKLWLSLAAPFTPTTPTGLCSGCRVRVISFNLPNKSNGVTSTRAISYLCVCAAPLKGVTGFCSTTWTAAAKGRAWSIALITLAHQTVPISTSRADPGPLRLPEAENLSGRTNAVP